MDVKTVRTHLIPLLEKIGAQTCAESLEITPVHAGMSGESFFVTLGARSFVLRAQLRERLPGHWDQLVRLSTLAGSAGVAPPVYAVDHERRLLLTERIPVVSLAGAMRAPGRAGPLLGQLGRFVGRVHNIPLPDDLIARSVEARTQALYGILEDRGPVPGFAREAMQAFRSAEDAAVPEIAQVLCHHDMNPSNLLYDGSELWCVDWETAGAGDPFGDLATLINFMLLDGPAIGVLLDGYFAERGQTIDGWQERLFVARRLAYLCYGVSFLELIEGDLAGYGGAERPTLAGCYRAMGEGTLDPATDAGRWALAGAMFRGYAELCGDGQGDRQE